MRSHKCEQMTRKRVQSGGYRESDVSVKPYGPHPIPAPGIGRRIGAAAELLGTRSSAYEVMQISSAALQRYIKEENAPPFDAMARLCLAAGVRLEWLATGIEPMRAGVGEPAPPPYGSQDARPDIGKLAEALSLIDQALVLTRRKASIEVRARLAAKAYTVLLEEGSVAAALRRIMESVETETGGSS